MNRDRVLNKPNQSITHSHSILQLLFPDPPIDQTKPDLLLIDVTMPDFEPVAAIRQIRADYPALKILNVQSRLEAVNYVMEHPEVLASSEKTAALIPVVSETTLSQEITILLVDDNARYRHQLRRMVGYLARERPGNCPFAYRRRRK